MRHRKVPLRHTLLLFALLGLALVGRAQPLLPTPTLVVIIDDLGDNLARGQAAVGMPGRYTVAVLPHTPNAAYLAEQAHQRGVEVMLHQPMANLNGAPLGPGGLHADMNREEFLATLRRSIASIPHVRGVNNHMGSALTQLGIPMHWLMAELKSQGLYFVDSRTSAATVAEHTAARWQLPHLARDVFLDNERNDAAITRQLQQAETIARRTGLAVVIGHAYWQTVKVLTREMPRLEREGIRLASVSEVLRQQAQLAQAERAATLEATAR